jgi:hypothetical protein
MKRKLIAGAAALTLLGTATLGAAQAQDRDRGRGGGGADAPRAEPRQQQQQQAPRVERSRPEAAPRVQRAPERSVQQPQRERPQRAEPRQRQQAEPRQRERQQPKAVERPRPEPKKQQAAPKREQAPDREKQANPKREPSPAGRQKADRKQDAPDRGQASNPRGDSQRVNRVQANNEQRKRVRDDVFRERGINRVSRKDFGVFLSVGSRVHRRHRLHHLTPAILAFAPIYRGYEYIIVDDTICIVDPQTYVIVDVIPSSLEYADSQQRPQLALSASEMAFIYASVPKDHTADVRVRLALGAEVPISVEVQLFPDGVIERVPQIQAYGFIVVDDDVVVVDPYDREVALVITE